MGGIGGFGTTCPPDQPADGTPCDVTDACQYGSVYCGCLNGSWMCYDTGGGGNGTGGFNIAGFGGIIIGGNGGIQIGGFGGFTIAGNGGIIIGGFGGFTIAGNGGVGGTAAE